MKRTTRLPAKQSNRGRNGFYWEESDENSKKRLKAVVSIKVVSVNKLNASFHQEQSRQLRATIQRLFRIDRFHVNDEDAYNNLILSLLSEYPPTHSISIGYKNPQGEEHISFIFFVSLQFLKEYSLPYVAQLIGRFIVARIRAEQTSYCLQQNDINTEYYLQCIRAVCKHVMEMDKVVGQ